MDLQTILDKNNLYCIDNINDINNTNYTADNLYDDVKDINNIFKNIDEILNIHGEQIDTIENNISLANLEIIESKNEIEKADGYFASYKRYQYILYGLAFVGTILILI